MQIILFEERNRKKCFEFGGNRSFAKEECRKISIIVKWSGKNLSKIIKDNNQEQLVIEAGGSLISSPVKFLC